MQGALADVDATQIAERSAEVLQLVSIDPVHLGSYPHQLSGGMRQRSMIAMALLFTPQLVIMDEPTSALDVVAQRSLMRQIKELQHRLGFAVVFVTHDISLVRHFSDRAVGYVRRTSSRARSHNRGFRYSSPPVFAGVTGGFPLGPGGKGRTYRHRRLTAEPGVAASWLPVPPTLRRRDAGVFVPRAAGVHERWLARTVPAVQGQQGRDREPGRAVGRGASDNHPLWPRATVPATPTPIDQDGQQPPLLEVSDLTLHFNLGAWWAKKTLHAVDDVSFTIGRQEIVALVGESGSGKTTVARMLAMVYKPTKGEVRFDGKALTTLHGRREKLAYRGQVPMVFQDPFSSVNPTYRVSHAIMRSIALHRPDIDGAARHAEALRVMDAVGLQPAEVMLSRYPYELSGGQRQRLGFAQALAIRPKLILADEPVSMLDVSIRVGILNMMGGLREHEGVSILYITHDLASARYLADRVIVMYAGHVVEVGPTEHVLASPRHPYTQLLLSAVPDPRAPLDEASSTDAGEPPKVVNPKPGCRFQPRCPVAVEACRDITPRLGEVAPGQFAACHVALAEVGNWAPLRPPTPTSSPSSTASSN